MGETVFREPVAPTPETHNTASFPHSDVTPDGFESETDVKPSERVVSGRPPIVVDLLDARPAYKTFDVESQTKEIDRFVNGEIERQKLKDTKDTYEKLVEGILKKLNLTETADPYAKIEGVHRYAKAQLKLQEAIKEHDELMNADPTSLSVDKMKRVLKERYGAATS